MTAIPSVRVYAFSAEGTWLNNESADVEGCKFGGNVFSECFIVEWWITRDSRVNEMLLTMKGGFEHRIRADTLLKG